MTSLAERAEGRAHGCVVPVAGFVGMTDFPAAASRA